MFWVCGWCRPGERLVRELEPFDQLTVTHGMCGRHAEEWRQALETARAQRAQEVTR